MKKTKTDGKTAISANEINKYLYCPYQWYYEKIYGTSELRSLYKERNEALGLTDSTGSNFARGSEYHSGYYARQVFIRRIKLLLLVICMAIGAACGVWFYYNVLIK